MLNSSFSLSQELVLDKRSSGRDVMFGAQSSIAACIVLRLRHIYPFKVLRGHDRLLQRLAVRAARFAPPARLLEYKI